MVGGKAGSAAAAASAGGRRTAAAATAGGGAGAGDRPRYRPMGMGLAEMINPVYVIILIVGIYAYGWYEEHKLHHLIGTDTIVEVTRVLDGDTFIGTTVPGGINAKFRLKQIDAPERDQPYGGSASAALESLLLGNPDREVAVYVWEQDNWGRYIVDCVFRDSIYTQVTHVQRELVERGMAWAFSGFSRDSPLIKAMEEAKAAQIGLWADENPTAPWLHRKRGRGDKKKRKGHDEEGANRRSSRRNSRKGDDDEDEDRPRRDREDLDGFEGASKYVRRGDERRRFEKGKMGGQHGEKPKKRGGMRQ